MAWPTTIGATVSTFRNSIDHATDPGLTVVNKAFREVEQNTAAARANPSDGGVSQAAVVIIGLMLGLACVAFALCFACNRHGRGGRKAYDSSSDEGFGTPLCVPCCYGYTPRRGPRGHRGFTGPQGPPVSY